MQFGSFLSSAGRIGEGIERYQTESEQRRLLQNQAALAQEQTSLARAELARMQSVRQAEQQRNLGLTIPEAPRVAVPQSVSISEPEADFSGLAAAGAAAVAVPTVGGAPAAGLSGVPRAAAPATPTARQSNGSGFGGARVGRNGRSTPEPGVTFRGVTVPGFSSADPVRLNTFGGTTFGTTTYRAVDPNASNFTRGNVEAANERQLRSQLNIIRTSIIEPLGSIRAQFVPQDERRRIELANATAQWYASPNAFEYFSRNPEMLVVAQQDPIGFRQALGRASDERAARERAGRSATAPAAELAPTPTAGVRAPGPTTQVPGATRRARAFDRQGEQYWPIIQQAAAMYGVDPIMLRRLIASESSFNPNAVNPQSGALGLAQIMPSHIQRGILTEEQARDPVAAIHFAAAHFAQNLRNEGGDYTMAMLRYKGALSPRGIAAMTPVVRDIVSGFSWDPQQVLAAVGPQPLRTRDPASNAAAAMRTAAAGGAPRAALPTGVQLAGGGGVALPGGGGAAFSGGGIQVASVQNAPVPVRMNASQFYLANPDATTLDMDNALRRRGELVDMAEIYRQTGSVDEFRAARQAIQELDNSLYFLQGMQGVQELELANDPRRLSAVWSYYAGVPIQLQPQFDGTYNILVNGQITRRGVSRAEITRSARSSFDREYAQAQSAAMAEQANMFLQSQLRMTEAAAAATSKAFADIQLALVQGEIDVAVERIKQLDPNGRVTALPDGTSQAILQTNGETFIIDRGGIQIPGAPEGVLSAPSRRRVVDVGVGG